MNFLFLAEKRIQNRVFQIALRVGGNQIFYCGRIFLLGGGNLRKSDFDIRNFFKAKKTFCKY